MKNNKIYVVLLVIIIVFFIIMFSLFGLNNIEQEKIKTTIIIGNSSVWRNENKKWINIRMQSSLDELSWKKYNVYTNHQELGTYSLWYSDNRWYAFDSNKKAVQTEGTIFAYDSNIKLKVDIPTTQTIDDYTYVYKVLEENNIDINSEFSAINKVLFDFDNDGIIEEFYTMTNALLFDPNIDTNFSIAFMVKNNEIYMIYKDIDKNKNYDGCKPYYNYFLDTNNDNISELILSCGKYSNLGQKDMLVQYIDNNFKIVISNQ